MKRKTGTIALGHIGLNVSDLDISEGFYQEVLGLRVADESLQPPFRYATMARDGKMVLTLWEQSSGRFKKRHVGLHHLAFEADSVEELNRTKGILENLGVRCSEGARLYTEGSRASAIHFEDPDGIPIELYSAHCADIALGKNAPIGLATRVVGAISNPKTHSRPSNRIAMDGVVPPGC